jgi:hypothetical protein
MTRARKNQIVVNLNSLGGKPVDPESRAHGKGLIYDAATDSYIHVEIALADHDHDVGDLLLIFENHLV